MYARPTATSRATSTPLAPARRYAQEPADAIAAASRAAAAMRIRSLPGAVRGFVSCCLSTAHTVGHGP
ncbi:hypothetical protein HNQ79_003209 [Streptomyces candidus]|uniref:Uncharacterized protein n=1 Tax=Streptomyces candidus TaxID=67283 RepID=A0A7X0HFT7_9ACTN|nr:hypothetical protein [Streptomyces candidus]